MSPDAFADHPPCALARCTLAHLARCRHPLPRGSGTGLPATARAAALP
jgi:hypothetical protein